LISAPLASSASSAFRVLGACRDPGGGDPPSRATRVQPPANHRDRPPRRRLRRSRACSTWSAPVHSARMTTLAAISGYYLILLIPAALAVVFVFILSRQKWERPKRDDEDSTEG